VNIPIRFFKFFDKAINVSKISSQRKFLFVFIKIPIEVLDKELPTED